MNDERMPPRGPHVQTFAWVARDWLTVDYPLAVGIHDRESGERWMLHGKLEPVSDSFVARPTVGLDKNQCQQLMDDLWGMGFRPALGIASTGQVEAMTDHLADLRKANDQLLATVCSVATARSER